jgi:hypothetical protein
VKKFRFILVFVLLLGTCAQVNAMSISDTSKVIRIDSTAKDSIEYELVVFDPGFEIFLVAQPPMEYFSEHYYKMWNIQYVTEWNYRLAAMPNSNLYETSIDYNPNTEYGIKLEYQLYYFFRYFEKANHITLISRGM